MMNDNTEFQRSVSDATADKIKLINECIIQYFQIDMFSIQIKNHSLNLTASGFFRLDNTTTFSVFFPFHFFYKI